MAGVQDKFRSLADGLRERYLEIVRASATAPHVPNHLWRSFENHLRLVLQWGDIAAAAKTRYKATREKIVFPDDARLATVSLVRHENRWLDHHMHVTDKTINDHVKRVIESERKYVDRLRKRTDVIEIEPLHRLEMFYRNAVGDVSAVSEQVQLSIPGIGGRFPFLEYLTRDDRRVRPTHFFMHGFLALRSWPGWRIIRPKNGYNCRCRTRLVSFREALDKGWVDRDGAPRFEVKWPNVASKENFEREWFPDPGWRGPKFVAA